MYIYMYVVMLFVIIIFCITFQWPKGCIFLFIMLIYVEENITLTKDGVYYTYIVKKT